MADPFKVQDNFLEYLPNLIDAANKIKTTTDVQQLNEQIQVAKNSMDAIWFWWQYTVPADGATAHKPKK